MPCDSCKDIPRPAPVCENKVLIIQICNSNYAKDDNFDIYLNNVYIGHVDLTMDYVLNGGMFIGDSSFPLTIVQPDFCCPIDPQIMPTFTFCKEILQFGINTLKFVRTQDNHNGNYGLVSIRNYTRDGITLVDPCFISGFSYGGEGEYTFDYSQCCYPSNPCPND